MVSLAAQEWINQGRAEGIAEGMAESKAEGMAESILIALETLFGPVPERIENRVREAEPEQLEGLFRRAMTTPSLQAFFLEEFQR